MAITQEVNIEMLEKLPDGNFKKKNPATKAAMVKFEDGTTVESHKAELATGSKLGHFKAGNGIELNSIGEIKLVGITPSFTTAISNLSLINGWLGQLSYVKDNLGTVHLFTNVALRDGVKTRNTTIGTLPVGYRPLATGIAFIVYGSDGAGGVLRIGTNGAIAIESTTMGTYSSFFISFVAKLN